MVAQDFDKSTNSASSRAMDSAADRMDALVMSVRTLRRENEVALPFVGIANAERVLRVRGVPFKLRFCRDRLAVN